MNTQTLYTLDNHNTYGGRLYIWDFCTDYEGSRNIASRIISDWRFDNQCKKNTERRKFNR